MPIKVRLSKGQLRYFRSKARATSNEVHAYLIGDIVSPSLAVVDYFAYPKEYADSTPEKVSWYVEDYQQVKKKAEERGRRIIGFIHSHPHPNGSVVMSSADHSVCVQEMFRLCGVCTTDEKRQTEVKFWVMDSPLPCEIIYAKSKDTSSASE